MLAAAVTVATLGAVELIALPVYVKVRFGFSRDDFLAGAYCGTPGAVVSDVAFNAVGFTGADHTRPKPPGTRRVLLIGGSTLFNRHFAERLSNRLSRSAVAPIEVTGGAIQGHTTAQNVRTLEHHFLGRGFDVALILEGINDLPANHVAPERFRDDYGHVDPFTIQPALAGRSMIAHFAWSAYWRVAIKPETVVCGSSLRSVPCFGKNLERMVDDVRGDGGRPLLATMPWYIPADYTRQRYAGGVLDYSNPDGYDPHPVEHFGPRDFVAQGMNWLNETTREVARRRETDLLDLTRIVPQKGELFGDVVHLNEKGTLVMLEEVAGAIERCVRAEPARTRR